jgi:nucleotide-binding universal stress UspA family protein
MAGTILIAFDGSDAAGRALDRAVEEAKDSGDPLVVLAVFEMLFDPEGPQNFGNINESAQMIPLVEPPELEPVLARARERIADAGLEADYLWAVGNPADKIAATARDRRARLVVIGSHHHSFLGRLFGTDAAAEVEREIGAGVVVVD